MRFDFLKKKRFWFYFAVVPAWCLIVCFVALLIFLSQLFPTSLEELKRAPSPDHCREAVLTRYSSGAFDSYHYSVSIVEAGNTVPSSIFSWNYLKQRNSLVQVCTPFGHLYPNDGITMEWRDDAHLEVIEKNSAGEIVKHCRYPSEQP